MSAGDVLAGVFVYFVINFAVGVGVLNAGNGGHLSMGTAVGIGAAVLALISFGGGAALIARRKPSTKALGIGLMIGWALTSIITVGVCTGLNPAMYTGA
ncbi:hypothetical protein BST20_17630 [Mycobacterium branderi]|uniref:Uncharacterized protein n=1 Tax=Mycobacterium branderi TaxID=43348 RepID=A0AA91RH81_9MYCO|nr:hypothetical protein [Mycobacterium branderi]ORA35530.1 hypothetical protein BST20_17630 [Mycobacterium branderi]